MSERRSTWHARHKEGLSRGERAADVLRNGMGSWTFVGLFLAAMAAWGERWLSGPEGTPLVLHHTTCDHDMHAVVVCSECAAPLDVRETRAQRGPGYRAEHEPFAAG